jgi:hypothetical protein
VAAVSAVGAGVKPIVLGSLMYGLKPVPSKEKKTYPGAKALISPAFYGTAEAVPFVESWFSRRLLGRTPTRILHPPQVT